MIKESNKIVGKNNKLYRDSLPIRIIRIPEIGILIPLIIVILIFYLINNSFFNPINIMAILKSASFTGLVTIGMAFALIAGQIDLSIGAVAGFGAIVSGVFITRIGFPIWLGLTVTIIMCAFIGLINGLLSVKLKIPAIIVTLGMLFSISGVTYLITMGSTIYPLPKVLVNFGNAKPLNTSWSFIIYIIVVIISDFILRKTIFGRKIYTTGANIFVARINGINTDMVRISTHVFISFLASLSGIMFMLRIGKGTPNIGVGWEFPIIAGAILGGVSLLGGYGTIIGAFLGVLIMQIIYNGLVIVGVKAEWQNLVIGIIMIVAAGFDIWRRTRKS